jgi:hypothetical protein
VLLLLLLELHSGEKSVMALFGNHAVTAFAVAQHKVDRHSSSGPPGQVDSSEFLHPLVGALCRTPVQRTHHQALAGCTKNCLGQSRPIAVHALRDFPPCLFPRTFSATGDLALAASVLGGVAANPLSR